MIKYFYTLIFLLSLAFSPLKAQLSIVEVMYNNPGEDLYEYVKVWNTSGQDLNLEGYSMSTGIEATFPNITVGGNEWFFVVADSMAFVSAFNTFDMAIVQATGALNNGGETITIVDANGQTIDEVTYDDGNGWPTFADGNGSSLHYCGTTGQDKNDSELWNLTPATLSFEVDDQPFYGLLGDIFFQCTERGVASFYNNRISVLEGEGSVTIPVYINRAEQSVVNVEITAADGTALAMDDYTLTTTLVSSDTDTVDAFVIEVMINDDTEQEVDETFIISFPGFTDQYLALTSSIEVSIIDNDTPLTESLILTGVWDAQPGFSGTKGAEFYALADIPDLSVFGVGVVNNGNGTDGVEYTFPAESVDAGTFIYLAEDEVEFSDYYGFAPNFIFTQINVNGDDAIELFENAQPLDVFGEANIDGSGTAWEYLDGWAYRVSGTTQDFDMFNEGNWTYGGIDALDGPATNMEANNPFPIGTYSTMAPTMVVANDVDLTLAFGVPTSSIAVTMNDVIPGDITSLDIVVAPSMIGAEATTDFNIEITIPDGFFGVDSLTYSVSNGSSMDEAVVRVTVEEPLNYPLLDIAQVSMEDALGVATEIGTTCELIGNVYGVNLSTTGALFTIIDDNGDGIAVFNNNSNLGYEVTEGDVVSVKGTITQFNGLTEIVADEIELFGTTAIDIGRSVDVLDETTESNLVELNAVMYTDITQWGGGNSGFNFSVVDDEGNVSEIRIDNDVDLFLMPVFGDEFSTLDITGIGGQFDNSSPFDSGYQLLPRYASDIAFTFVSVDEVFGSQLEIFPNPTSKSLTLTSEESLDEVRISDALGRLVIQVKNPALQSEINVQSLLPGIYNVQCVKGIKTFAMRLIVQ